MGWDYILQRTILTVIISVIGYYISGIIYPYIYNRKK